MNLALLLLNSQGNTLWVVEEDLARTQVGHEVALLRMRGSETRDAWTDSRGVVRQRAVEARVRSSRGVMASVS